MVRGLVQVGGSAAFVSNDQQSGNSYFLNILNIPLAVTAEIIEYNVPEIPSSMHLNFTATLLTQIYNSTIQYWNDTNIKQLNPGVASILPYAPIWPTYRSDAAGDTWLFTQYLSRGDPYWNSTNRGYGLAINWPSCDPAQHPNNNCASTPQSAEGNPGIVIVTNDRKYSLSYVSVEALDQWVKRFGLGYGFLQNKVGNFVEATLDNVKASIAALAAQTPYDERLSLVDAPGVNSYPIVGYGYALVNKQQLNPDFAQVIRTFLRYCLLPAYGSSPYFLNVYHFAPLPPAITQLSLNQIAQVGP